MVCVRPGSSGRDFHSPATEAAAANRDRPSTPSEGHGAHRRCWPEVSRRWRDRHPASAGHLIRRKAPVERGR